MKKHFLLLIATTFALILSGCNGNGDEEKAAEGEKTEEQGNGEEATKNGKENKDNQVNQNAVEENGENKEGGGNTEKNNGEEGNAIDDRITHQGGGLGDTLSVYEEKYGENAGSDMLARFDNDYILANFLEDRAMRVTVQFKTTNQPIRTKEEAFAIAESLVPYDAAKVDEYVSDSGSEVIVYKSELLAEVFEQDAFINGEKGTFITILQPSVNDDGYYEVILATGNNP